MGEGFLPLLLPSGLAFPDWFLFIVRFGWAILIGAPSSGFNGASLALRGVSSSAENGNSAGTGRMTRLT